MRLIYADALIEDLSNILGERFHGNRKVRIGEVYRAIDNQPTVPDIRVGKWIPVSERLPQASKHILFSVKGKSYTSYGFHNDGIWTDINGAWYTDKEVIAWMPLPESYKGDEDE